MKIRENFALKALAFVLAVAAFTGAAAMGWYQVINWEVIWGDDSPAEGYTIEYLERQDAGDLNLLLYLNRRENENQSAQLSTYEEQQRAAIEKALAAGNTNLCWQVRDSAGAVCYGNTLEDVPAPAEGMYTDVYGWTEEIFSAEEYYDDWMSWAKDAVNIADPGDVIAPEDWRSALSATVSLYQETGELDGIGLDTVFLDEDGWADMLIITDEEGQYVYGPTVRACMETNEHGWRYYMYNDGWYQAEELSTARESLEITLWLDTDFPVDDAYRQAYVTLASWQAHRGLLLGLDIACAAAGLALVIFLCAGAGRKRGVEGVHLHGFHRIPGDLLFAVIALGVVLTVGFGVDGLLMGYYQRAPGAVQLLLMGGIAACVSALTMTWIVTFAARCKAHTLWRNTVIWRICHGIGRLCRGIAAALPLVWKVALIGVGYLLLTFYFWNRFCWYYSLGWIFLWVLLTVAVIMLLCLWACQWKRIRRGAREIIGGHPDARIDTRHMLPDLKAHADELNNLGQAISAAVDEQMKSERFKAELITNVSHDLKTPLTSIINYVDLLKKEDIPNPTAQEYIEVLDRKSQRLKKLTEDLVEASKASTGALAVNRERLDAAQLIRQAAGEYEEKLTAAGLTLVTDLPEQAVTIHADGRHVWRVLDNLLGNCVKYALQGTRVYLDAAARDGNAVITVKNISRQPLNVPVEQLMERFVRGDESRTTEGSGLGLSIARSLTELQGGQFSLTVDGDLFKATVAFPLVREQ